jgi:hypothetical protein
MMVKVVEELLAYPRHVGTLPSDILPFIYCLHEYMYMYIEMHVHIYECKFMITYKHI